MSMGTPLPLLSLPPHHASPPRLLPTVLLRRRQAPIPPQIIMPTISIPSSQFKQTCPYNSNTLPFGLLSSSSSPTTNVSLWRQQQQGDATARRAAAAAAATASAAVAPWPATGTTAEAAAADRRGAEGARGEGGACQGLAVDERQAAWLLVVRGMYVRACVYFIWLCVCMCNCVSQSVPSI